MLRFWRNTLRWILEAVLKKNIFCTLKIKKINNLKILHIILKKKYVSFFFLSRTRKKNFRWIKILIVYLIWNDPYIILIILIIIFNEGSHSLLCFLKSIGLNFVHNAHTYAEKTDAVRISLADKRAAESTREGRLLCRQQQIAFLKSATSTEKLLYGPEIDDSV